MTIFEITNEFYTEATFERENYFAFSNAILDPTTNHLLFHVQNGYIVLDDKTFTIKVKDEKTYEKLKELFYLLVAYGEIVISGENPDLF